MARLPRPGEAASSVGDTPPRASSPRKRAPTGDTGTGNTRRSSRTDPEPVSPKLTKRDTDLQSDLAQLYTLTGVMVGMVNPPIATSIVENAEEAATAWVELSRRNPRVRTALVDLTTASIWGGVVSVHLKMFAPALSGVFAATNAKTVSNSQDTQSVHTGFTSPPTDPIAQTPMSEETVEAQLAFLQATDPGAYAMAMMALGRDTGTGGPGDTVRVNGNGNAVQMPDLSKPDL